MSSYQIVVLPQAVQRAFNSSPCMWITARDPARSCRSSMFCVAIITSPGRTASSRANASCAPLGVTEGCCKCRRRAS
jgi:hypothetical protein